jgi:DNA-binding NarL/FixJ family response regulator
MFCPSSACYQAEGLSEIVKVLAAQFGAFMNHARILLADDQPKVRMGLRLLLEQEEWASVVGEAAEAESLLAQAEVTQPDLVLLDWSLHRSERPDLLSALRGRCPGLAVVVLSGQPDVEQEALDAGADAFVSKADPPEQLLSAIFFATRERAAGLEKNA